MPSEQECVQSEDTQPAADGNNQSQESEADRESNAPEEVTTRSLTGEHAQQGR